MTQQLTFTAEAINEAAKRSGESFRREVAARRAGTQFNQLAELALTVAPLNAELAQATSELAAATQAQASSDARKLEAARNADPDMQARVAARRAARRYGS